MCIGCYGSVTIQTFALPLVTRLRSKSLKPPVSGPAATVVVLDCANRDLLSFTNEVANLSCVFVFLNGLNKLIDIYIYIYIDIYIYIYIYMSLYLFNTAQF